MPVSDAPVVPEHGHPHHLCGISCQIEMKTDFFFTGQWVSGSNNHLQVPGSDNHLQAICARFGSEPGSGYEM